MITQSAQEEAKLYAMQRVWSTRRGLSSTSLFENAEEDFLNLPPPVDHSPNAKGQFVPTCCKDEGIDEVSDQLQEQHHLALKDAESVKRSSQVVDAAVLGDIPAKYTICALEPHQMPAVGVYVDKRIIPGFKYRIRPLPAVGHSPTENNRCLFNGRALMLSSIGRGFARRFTFEADANHLNDNDNYFYSDNRPEGYAFELEVISVGDKFTIFDSSKEAQGTAEVISIEGSQTEISSVCIKHGVEKRVNVKFTAKVEFYETGVAKPKPLAGVAVCLKQQRNGRAAVTKVLNVVIERQRYTLLPGMQEIHRRVTVRGQDIGDVPTKYSMTGLAPFELPVVGTFVDPRIIPGFYYKVRPNDRKEHLFGGRALKLVSIGMGYAKRLTFQPDSLVCPDNYLWSDNHPDGLGLEVCAVRKGMKFSINAGSQLLGQAEVFRADKPQMEETMDKIETNSGRMAIVKYIHIDVICHIKLEIAGGGTREEKLMRVYGLAVVRKEPKVNEARIVRVENVGMDSQLNILFAQNRFELVFLPIKNN